MKRVVFWVVGIVAVVAYIKFAVLSHAGSCDELKAEALDILHSLQQCESDAECTYERFSCPFPCVTPLNRNGRSDALGAINRYNKNCMMICPDCEEPLPSRVACINSVCTAQ